MQQSISVYLCIETKGGGGGGDGGGGGNGRDSVRHLARIDRDITKINRRVGIRRECFMYLYILAGCISLSSEAESCARACAYKFVRQPGEC